METSILCHLIYVIFFCYFCLFLLQLSNEQGNPTWKPVFLAVTDKDLMMYDTAPWSKEEWATPFQSHPLLATRYICTCIYNTTSV